MIFDFTFSFLDDFNILRDILKYQAIDSKICFKEKIFKEENSYVFSIKATEEEMQDFAQKISLKIPLSINFKFKSLEVSQDDEEEFQETLEASRDILDAYKIGSIIQNQDINEVKKWLHDPKFYNLGALDDFDSSFEVIVQKLLEKEKILINNSRGKLLISLEKISNQAIFWDIDALKTFLRVDDYQIQALASYEKPSMMLCPKEVFVKEFDSEFLECMLPYDLFLGVLGKKCLQNNISYVFTSFAQEDIDIKTSVVYKQEVPIMEQVTVSKNGSILFRDGKKVGSFPKFISTYSKELDCVENQRLIVCISKDNPLFFWIKDRNGYKNTIQLDFELNPRLLLMMIREYESGDRLIENFKKTFLFLDEKLEKIDDRSRKTQNIFELFSVIGFILGYADTLDSQIILQNARKYLRDKGPRIDFKLLKLDDGIIKLDYPRILRSCMSFRLAGVDDATLSYGILDSMGEFYCNFIQDLYINFSLKKVLVFGNALEEKIILDKILSNMPRDIDLVLPKKGFLDY
ncbi:MULTISPECIES: hypothetical protein [unclassified Helicobacter]|uniref:hypothetical protein n=1 Tax=unclassified Helicobacter TaxID=2593540 RepID=UPI000CF039EF|nr:MULTISPECIES: hypothetical protein [unclassified Helicobacter]